MRRPRGPAALLTILMVSIPATVVLAQDEEGASRTVEPMLRVMGIQVVDTIEGNGDGGLHPGETAGLRIWLSNRDGALARYVSATLEERVDHPDVELLQKSAFWPDLPGTGAGAYNLAPDFLIRVAATRPCGWRIPLRLTIRADGGYLATSDFEVELTSPEPSAGAPTRGAPTIDGADPAGSFGAALAVGDYNGDGLDDLAVGAPDSDGDPGDPFVSSGEIRILYGGTFRADGDVSLTPQHRALFHSRAGDRAGGSLAMGDYNGDGDDDLVMAVPNAGSAGWLQISGGSDSTGPHDMSICCGTPILNGEDPADSFPSSIALGDFDGDGREDILIGARYVDGEFGTVSYAGKGYLITSGYVNNSDVSDADVHLWGTEAGESVGDLAAMGDFNGDGLQDVVLGGSSDVAWIVYGTPSPAFEYDLVNGAPGIDRLTVSELNVDALVTGDFNGDGYDDLALGGSNRVQVTYGSASGLGSRSIVSRDPAVSTLEVPNLTSVLEEFGDALATGDHDGDGYDDLLIGNPYSEVISSVWVGVGSAYLAYGGPAGIPSHDLGQEGYGVRRFQGIPGDYFGEAVAMGDFDDDGYDDVAIGKPGSTSTEERGAVDFYPGGPRTSARWDPDSFAFIDATAGTPVPLACDDCGADVPLGFDFVFDNRSHDTVTVSSNGYLTFGGDATAPLGFCPGNGASPNAVIAAFWDDLTLENRGAAYVLTEGVAPDRRTTIAWVDVPLWPDEGGATFEVTLFESSNRIVMQYLDTEFGVQSGSNAGFTAVAGIESTTGAYGAQFNCRNGRLTAGTAVAYRWFASPSVVYQEDFESGAGGFTATGLWNLNSEPNCTPAAVSGSSAFYYGQSGVCNYDTGAANQGDLTSPVIPALPQDARLEFWSLLSSELAPYDISLVQVQGATPGYGDLVQLDTHDTSSWIFAGTYPEPDIDTPGSVFQELDLSGYTGEDLNLRFSFEATDDIGNTSTGWMVDDLTIRACPVHSAVAPAGAAAEALATSSTPALCEDQAGRVDAVGSYCTACSSGLTYQWSRDGATIGGATSPVFDIPAGETPGSYGYSVEIGCPGQPVCDDVSDPSAVQVVGRPGEIGPTLLVGTDGHPLDLRWKWNDVANADDYALRSDSSPVDRNGGFGVLEGVATSGVTGVTTVRTPGLVYYLVVARNPVCGEGIR